jgi:hypothetical protein
MNYLFRNIWADIKARRNIDLYITIFLGFVVAVLNLFADTDDPDVRKRVASVTLALLAAIAFSLLQDRHKSHVSVTISSDNNANVDYLCDYIAENKISRARLIQYSGDMIRRVVEKLLEKGVSVELLLQHPSKALNQFQIEKMASFQHRVKNDFRNNQNLIIRYYKETASVKGIKFDNDFLSMGWYIYRSKSGSENVPWLYGHNNATITVHLGNSNLRDLVATFDETFQMLWETAEPHSEQIDATIDQMLRQGKKARKQ